MLENSAVDGPSLPAFSEVVQNIQVGNDIGLGQLYRIFGILSSSLRRQMGFQEFEDRIHDIFIVVVEAIRDGRLREPAALTSYIHGVARLSVCSKIGVRVRHRKLAGTLRHWESNRRCGRSPEDQVHQTERVKIMRELLASLSDREREVLTRFYLYEQTKEQICRDLDMTETQFRLTKSRGKQRLERFGVERQFHPQEAA